MVSRVSKTVRNWRRQRMLASIRREFARCGFSIEHIEDAAIEAALTRGEGPISDVALSAKSIYLAAQRLSADTANLPQMRIIKPAVKSGHL